MFKIIAALSIDEGKVVRLKQGDFSKQLRYDYSPLDLARLFEDHGIEVLHFVDLDGMKAASPVNYGILETLAGHTELKIDYSGGIRTDGDINKVLEYGATYFTASSVAVNDQDLFASWIISYGREKLSLLADTLDKKVVYQAWKKQTDFDLFEHIAYFYDRGLKYVKVTDIKRDGLLEGPNFELYQELVDRFPNAYIAASGGVRSIEDIRKLMDMGLYAVIIGRALYEDKIKLSEIRAFIEQ
jgi:phosphoribosylformimino-5-aminoimidazole carboxamide ribotide isomerase